MKKKEKSDRGALDGLREKVDVLYTLGRLTDEEYQTLAGRLETGLAASVIYLDDFLRPQAEWRGRAEACALPDGFVWAAPEQLAEVYPVPNAFGAYVKR